MNKKGFTLIEVICVFALLGIIGVSMTFGLKGMIKNKNDNEQKEIQSKFKSACITYKSTENKSNCPLDKLLKKGLITKDVYNKCKNEIECKIEE